MSLSLGFKDGIDWAEWRAASALMAGFITSWNNVGVCCSDMRSRKYAHPSLFYYHATTSFLKYNYLGDGWMIMNNPITMSGSLGIGSEMVFVPSQGPTGSISSGCTSTKIVLSTALPNSASVTANQLANRDDKLGFIVRIVGKASGKVEERRVVANTSGTTPTLYLDLPLSFTPASGDVYEFLSGRVYILNPGTVATGYFKYFDVLTGVINTSALSITNLPSTINTSGNNVLLTLDEAYVPASRYPGEGFVVDTVNASAKYDISYTDWSKKCLIATGSAAGTLTGQATNGDAAVAANQFRNFQIRIIEDTGTPTAVNQRRKISYHPAGPSCTYVLASNWTVTPSATAKFVIENDNDKMLLFGNGLTTIYNYNHAANTWDTSTWAARSSAMTYGFAYQQFGLDVEGNSLDPDKQQRNSFIVSPRGNQSATYDIFDISNSGSATQATTTGSWSNGLTFDVATTTFLQGTSSASATNWQYVPNAYEGRYVYIQHPSSGNTNGTLGMAVERLDLYTKRIEPYSNMRVAWGFPNAGTSFFSNNKGGMYLHVDGQSVIPMIYFPRVGVTNNEWYQLIITR